MNLAYDLKQKNPNLRRNIKFDEEDAGLYMDIQLNKDGLCKRVKPEQAKELAKTRKRRGPEQMGADELRSLMGSDDEDEDADE